jgi:hypothetical protein
MNKTASLIVKYYNIELEYIYNPEYIYYEEAIEMISCVCQNTVFPKSIKKMQSILSACANVRSNSRWRDDTMLPRLFDQDQIIDISKYRIKIGNPSANSESKVFVEDIWVRAEEGWILAEKKCVKCFEKKPFRLFLEVSENIDKRSKECTRCLDNNKTTAHTIRTPGQPFPSKEYRHE